MRIIAHTRHINFLDVKVFVVGMGEPTVYFITKLSITNVNQQFLTVIWKNIWHDN